MGPCFPTGGLVSTWLFDFRLYDSVGGGLIDFRLCDSVGAGCLILGCAVRLVAGCFLFKRILNIRWALTVNEGLLTSYLYSIILYVLALLVRI